MSDIPGIFFSSAFLWRMCFISLEKLNSSAGRFFVPCVAAACLQISLILEIYYRSAGVVGCRRSRAQRRDSLVFLILIFPGFLISSSLANDLSNNATVATDNNTAKYASTISAITTTATINSKSNNSIPATSSTTYRGSLTQEKDSAWDSALNGVFSMLSQSNPVSNNEVCRRSVQDLMTRQNIPQTIAELRKLDDISLYKLAMLASVGGMSRWGRDSADSNLLTITEDGHLIHPYSPGAVESDVMLCIICALLTVIATFHLIPPHTHSASPPPAGATRTASKVKHLPLQQQPQLGQKSVLSSAAPVPTAATTGNFIGQFYHNP